MRWVRVDVAGNPSFGILEGDVIHVVSGSPFDAYSKTGTRLKLAETPLLAPIVPPTFYAAGVNYTAHLSKAKEKVGGSLKLPEKADIGYRANNALTGHDSPIIVPKDSAGTLQTEAELVVVIGKKCKYLSKEDVPGVIFGYTIGNDVSERPWQRGDRTLWRAKNSDTFKPMGPYIDTDFKLGRGFTRIRLNGQELEPFHTADMLFDIETFLVAMTRNVTLVPGDMVWMGTDEPTPNMVAGDTVEIEIDGLGTLRNHLVAEA